MFNYTIMGKVSETIRGTTEGIASSLREIERQTQDVFLHLGSSLSRLGREMRAGFEASDQRLGCILGQQANGCTDRIQILNAITATRDELGRRTSDFKTMVSGETTRLESLQNGIRDLEQIATMIEAITGDSQEMELVSLNAMTVALKAGSIGRAFSYITEELKRLASKTISLAAEISRGGADLIEIFRRMEGGLETARRDQEQLVTDVEDGAEQSFRELQAAADELANALVRLREKSLELRTPIDRLMETIQLQDIIRQSIDHIVLALGSVDIDDQLEHERRGQELHFISRLPVLAGDLLADVIEQIDRSVEAFEANATDAHRKIEELEQQQAQLQSSSGATVVDRHFAESESLLVASQERVEANLTQKEQLLSESKRVTEQVETLEARFRSFSAIASRFRNVDVASRIEVAKQFRLREMGADTEEMTELTKRIEQDVNDSLAQTQEFTKSVGAILRDQSRHYHDEREFIRSFGAAIRSAAVRLSESRDAVQEVVAEFSLFSDDFRDTFLECSRGVEALRSVREALIGLKSPLATLGAAIEQELADHDIELDESIHELNDSRLSEIVNRFTILSHKNRGAQLGDITIEQASVESGEVTLF